MYIQRLRRSGFIKTEMFATNYMKQEISKVKIGTDLIGLSFDGPKLSLFQDKFEMSFN